ncbi:MAG: Gfo/Idh/MocA family oxidoreductase [Treponema sp.]|jgi:predicted dehydrogenase|nr:Gfo/Idh/MocA family oxidoreductase [Treponema sp.]
MKKVRLGIIGIGIMGKRHAKTIIEGQVPDMELVAVADTNQKAKTWATENFGADFPIYHDSNELFSRDDLDAVLIATPHYQHPSLTIDALKKGLHVLCEKPAGVYTKHVREMNEVAAKSDKVFAMMYNVRTNNYYRKMHELVKDGSLGAIMRTSWIITNWFRSDAYYTSGEWRGSWNGEGGGVLLNQCPHNLDLLQWICGMPNRVHAFCHNGKWHNIEVEDDVTAYFEYPNGATGTFVTTTGETPGTNRFEISLEKGKLTNNDGNELILHRLDVNQREFCKTTKEFFGKPECTIEKLEVDSGYSEHAGIMRSFAGHILRGEPLIAKGHEGINGLILSNAIHLSSWLNKTIEIPFDEDLFLAELNKRRAASNIKLGNAVS